jgi:hypothetical protein
MRPAHCRGDLAGDADRQRANVLVLDRKRERPFSRSTANCCRESLGALVTIDAMGCQVEIADRFVDELMALRPQ